MYRDPHTEELRDGGNGYLSYHDEWKRIEAELSEPYKSFFTFLVRTGLRYPEATGLKTRDFKTTPDGQHVVQVVRAWTRDENNVPYVGPPKTKKSKRTVALKPTVSFPVCSFCWTVPQEMTSSYS